MEHLQFKNESGYPFERATDGSIGFDLRAVIGEKRDIPPGRRWAFDTGISIALPKGWGALVQPRSGMGLHHGVIAVTGVIDRDYRGRIKAVLINLGHDPYPVHPGDKIAQLVFIQQPDLSVLYEVQDLDITQRGDSGFGSTGR